MHVPLSSFTAAVIRPSCLLLAPLGDVKSQAPVQVCSGSIPSHAWYRIVACCNLKLARGVDYQVAGR